MYLIHLVYLLTHFSTNYIVQLYLVQSLKCQLKKRIMLYSSNQKVYHNVYNRI
jgi:hypothetical protein